MQAYLERKYHEMVEFVRRCEEQFGMSSEEFLSYYRELESHGTEEEYDWYVCLSFLGHH
jgi:hypothetical protein